MDDVQLHLAEIASYQPMTPPVTEVHSATERPGRISTTRSPP